MDRIAIKVLRNSHLDLDLELDLDERDLELDLEDDLEDLDLDLEDEYRLCDLDLDLDLDRLQDLSRRSPDLSCERRSLDLDRLSLDRLPQERLCPDHSLEYLSLSLDLFPLNLERDLDLDFLLSLRLLGRDSGLDDLFCLRRFSSLSDLLQ